MVFLTIDPGLDGVGVAVFDIGLWRQQRNLPDNLRSLWALRRTALIETSTKDALPVRLHSIAAQVTEAVLFWSPVKVYVERPAIDGVYRARRRGNNQSTLAGQNRLYESRGAILAATTAAMLVIQHRPEDVIDIEAGGIPKGNRHRMLAYSEDQVRKLLERPNVTRTAGPVTLPRGPRGGIPSDEWDAVWIGIQAFSRIEADMRPPRVAVAP